MESQGGDRIDAKEESNEDDDKKNKPLLALATATKGKGLKKWRRIQRRDFTSSSSSKEVPLPAWDDRNNSGDSDYNRALKRDSRLALGRSTASSSSSSAAAAVNPTPTTADSDNSEDPSSKSSTPKVRSHRTSTSTHHNHNQHHRGASSGRYSLMGRLDSTKIETTKKLRGGGVKVDKDTSYSSSVESDLRSSSNVFFSEISSNNNNNNNNNNNGGRHLNNFDVNNSSEAQASDQQSNDYFYKGNGDGEEEVSQDDDTTAVEWEAQEQYSDNNRQPSTTQDLLAESILSLQAVQEALEKEIQNFGEIGKERILLPDDSNHHFLLNPEFHSVVSEVLETQSSGQVPCEERENSSSLPLEAELIAIHHKVYILERNLAEAMTMLEVKESRVVELEGILYERELPKGERGSSLQSLREKCRELETELEDLFKQKIEAEVECLTMRKTSQKLKVVSEDQVALFEEQKTLIGEQNKILHKFKDAESNVVVKKEQADKLASSGELVDTEEVLKMHGSICRYTFCFSAQLMLLLLVFGLLFLQLWPGISGFAPT